MSVVGLHMGREQCLISDEVDQIRYVLWPMMPPVADIAARTVSPTLL